MKTAYQLSPEDKIFWQQHIESYKAGGLSRMAYCRLHGLIYHQFNRHLKKDLPVEQHLIAIKLKPAEQASALPVLCSLNLDNKHHLHIHDMKIIDYILARFSA